MPLPLLPAWTGIRTPVVGMLHLPPLAGAPGFGGDNQSIREAVLNDAAALASGGVDGLLIENLGDSPYFAARVPAHTVAQMTALALAVRDAVDLPLGVNVLRNDARSALAVAAAAQAAFIRVNVLCGACVTDQGVIEGEAAELMRCRAAIGADRIKVLADVRVKHAAPLVDRPIAQETAELVERARADGVIVSGTVTGQPAEPDDVRAVKQAAGDAPVFVGSGLTPETARSLGRDADGFIVGTQFKRGGRVTQPVDARRVKEFMAQLR